MSYYLLMDGVDDYLRIPSLSFSKIVIDATIKSGQSKRIIITYGPETEFNLAGSGTNVRFSKYTVKIDGINYAYNASTSNFINRRALLEATSSDGVISPHTISLLYVPADVYSITFYNEETIAAHYDMSTGTVQDMSGNEKHATLYGGTWIDDGQGGGTEPEPTAAQYDFATKQSIYVQRQVNHATKQAIYKQAVTDVNIKQSIYKQTSVNHATKQNIYKPINEQFSTKQAIYKQVTADFATMQIIIALTNYVAEFATRQIIYKQAVIDVATKQSIFKPSTVDISTKQSIYKQTSSEFKTMQRIFKRVFNDVATKQLIYKHVAEDVPLQIRIIIPGAPELIGVIRLKGKRELTVNLRGGLNMIPNQNFSMVSGDTTTLVIDINENLTGATVKWGMKKRGAPTLALTKIGSIVDGKIHIVLDKADTEEISGLFVHECEVTDQSGNVSTVTTGSVNILADMI